MLEANRAELEKAGVLWWHDKGFKGKGVTVAVIDLGCPRASQADYVEYPFNDETETAHGCNVCSVIHEVVPEAKIVLLPLAEKSIDYIIEHGIKLVSISLNYDIPREWFKKLQGKASVFCSAGNDPSSKADYPSLYDWTISVGAYLESTDKPASYSTPCADIVSYTNIAIETDNGSFEFNGTSAATPFARGMSALVYGACLEAGFEPTIAQLHKYTLDNAIDVYTAGEDAKTGHGLFKLPEELPMKIHMKIGDVNATLNDKPVVLAAAPTVINNTTVVPLRFISEAHGDTVNYNSTTKEIDIIKL